MIWDDDFTCLGGQPASLSNFTTVRWFSTRFVKILTTRKMNTFPGPYPSIPLSSLYLSSDFKVTAPSASLPSRLPITYLPTIGVFTTTGPKDLADEPGVGIDAADCWSLGRFQGFDKLCAWFCRRLRDVDMRLQTSLSRRRSSISVHLQSTACASTRSGYKCYSTIRLRGSEQGRRARTARFAKWGDQSEHL